MAKKIGIMVGRENTWPSAFIEEVNRRKAGVTAEFVKLDGTGMASDSGYAVIIDRISHEIPYYRAFLRTAMIGGATIVNNPFIWSATDDKLLGATFATHLGVAHPRTIALPSHEYIEGIDHGESLRNLTARIPWEQHIEHVGGFPVILKPNSGGGFKKVFKLHTMDQLWEAYNQTGSDCMILQEFIAWEKYVRCMCIGQSKVLIMKFDVNEPYPHRYFDEPNYLTPNEHASVEDAALKLCRAFGYDMNTCEFALKDGVVYAIDFTNPAPDMDYWSLKEKFFAWVVSAMADMCIEKALAPHAPISEISPRVLFEAPPSVPAYVTAPADNDQVAVRDPLIDINGIGKVIEQRLNAAGIYSFSDLATQIPERLREIAGLQSWQDLNPETWIEEAKERIAGTFVAPKKTRTKKTI